MKSDPPDRRAHSPPWTVSAPTAPVPGDGDPGKVGRYRPAIGAHPQQWHRRARAAGLVALAVLAGCGAPGLDEDQAAEERRTCASLRERVAGRSLEGAGLLDLVPPADDGDKLDPLDPRVLASDPDEWYLRLARALAASDLGPVDRPTGVSPASRLVEQCRNLP